MYCFYNGLDVALPLVTDAYIFTSFLFSFFFVRATFRLQFVWTYVFEDDKELVRSLGTLLWTGADNMPMSTVKAKSQSLPLQQRFVDVSRFRFTI